MSNASAWFKHLRMRRGLQIVSQALYMWKLHQTPFNMLIDNILDVLGKHNSYFTFPTVAYTAKQDVELIRSIIHNRHEIASHGYKHIRYQFLPKKIQDLDMKRSIDTFTQIGVKVTGFRAPYNMYNKDTPFLIEKYGFIWDGGIGYNPKYRKGNKFFKIKLNNDDASFTCIPLNNFTDDLLIDDLKLNSETMGKVFKKVLDRMNARGGLVMFDLHPIRIGQKKYVKSLETLVEYGNKLGGWFPTVTEAIKYYSRNKTWKHDAPFCVLLTGDIDNFVFIRDYLSRLTS